MKENLASSSSLRLVADSIPAENVRSPGLFRDGSPWTGPEASAAGQQPLGPRVILMNFVGDV